MVKVLFTSQAKESFAVGAGMKHNSIIIELSPCGSSTSLGVQLGLELGDLPLRVLGLTSV